MSADGSPEVCVTLHGIILQPYWIFVLSSLSFNLLSSVFGYVRSRCHTAVKSDDLSVPLRRTASDSPPQASDSPPQVRAFLKGLKVDPLFAGLHTLFHIAHF